MLRPSVRHGKWISNFRQTGVTWRNALYCLADEHLKCLYICTGPLTVFMHICCPSHYFYSGSITGCCCCFKFTLGCRDALIRTTSDGKLWHFAYSSVFNLVLIYTYSLLTFTWEYAMKYVFSSRFHRQLKLQTTSCLWAFYLNVLSKT